MSLAWRSKHPGAVERETSATRTFSRRRLVVLAGVLVVLVLLCAGYLLAVEQRYRAARESAHLIQDRYGPAGSEAGVDLKDLPTLKEDLARLEEDLGDLQGLVDAPLVGRFARHAPVVGGNVATSQRFIAMGRELTAIARDATAIADETRLTFETSGMATSDGASGPTWLDVVDAHRAEIEELERRFDAVLTERDAIDERQLPGSAQAMLPEIDRMLAKAEGIRDEYYSLLPLFDLAFGANDKRNYVILLQNREEIRPGGGFPGTFAAVTLRDGQLAEYAIYDIRTLDGDYVAKRQAPITAPGPIRKVLGQEEFLPHDAFWSPDFTESAATFESMYAKAGWPELTGVVAVDDSVVREILAILGPYEVVFDGESQTVTADNFMELIEERRDLTWQDLAAHKQVVAVLGSSLIDQIKAADFGTKKQIYFALREAADRRQVQVHMVEEALQAEVVARGWDGALLPEPSVPTLATTVAGLTGGKKALTIFPEATIEIAPSGQGYRVRWTITLDHRGDPNGNP
ncbi:MAG TPA: DUF4012 domain-containing protein, partial [Thermomicrobiales bacterium]|nr:DUF4012 domain-containing protein [Thermomicrobiales bacterium]